MKGNSNCCDAVLVNGICKDCGDHAGPILYDCEMCKDTGEIDCDHLDRDGHYERGTDSQRYPDCLSNDEE